ncbi:MAG: acyl-CoA dehydrogenase family protein [Chloroflexota bacterium]|nr:acyl-CoA dehydrogenase family protein [Chloroflexota bacterium]
MDQVQAAADGLSLEELRAAVRTFAEREIAPLAAEIDATDAFPRQLWPGLGDLGVLGPTVARDQGGAGLGFLEHLVIVEEISRASASVGLSYAAHSNLCVHNLWTNGTPAQRSRWLPALLSGEHLGALAMSEPDAGSDVLGSMRCAARRVDGGWLANGSKMWITNGPEADVVLVYMRTEDGGGAPPISALIVERGMDGFRSAQHLDKLGMRGSGTCELLFEDCLIPDDHMLGAPGDGVRVLMSGLDTERLVLCGGPIGIMQAALDLVLPYVRERRQFGKPIGSFELMQGKLADMYVALESSRSFAYRVAAAFDDDPSVQRSADAAASLLHASERAVEVSLEAIQALGGAGYLNESDAGRLLRDAKLYTIGAGTNEIRRMLIGRSLTGNLADNLADNLG